VEVETPVVVEAEEEEVVVEARFHAHVWVQTSIRIVS
jgi:hypothetical protein